MILVKVVKHLYAHLKKSFILIKFRYQLMMAYLIIITYKFDLFIYKH
jgi:hypothetical protein